MHKVVHQFVCVFYPALLRWEPGGCSPWNPGHAPRSPEGLVTISTPLQLESGHPISAQAATIDGSSLSASCYGQLSATKDGEIPLSAYQGRNELRTFASHTAVR